MLDLYKALNDNTELTYSNAFNPATPVLWERPVVILPARMAKVAFQVAE
jgi:hypothetical protein